MILFLTTAGLVPPVGGTMTEQIFMDDKEGFYMSYFYCEKLKKHTVRYWTEPYYKYNKVENKNGRITEVRMK